MIIDRGEKNLGERLGTDLLEKGISKVMQKASELG
jgi:hypothetical protein